MFRALPTENRNRSVKPFFLRKLKLEKKSSGQRNVNDWLTVTNWIPPVNESRHRRVVTEGSVTLRDCRTMTDIRKYRARSDRLRRPGAHGHAKRFFGTSVIVAACRWRNDN